MSERKLLTEEELLAALNSQAGRTAVWRWRQQGMPHVKLGRSARYDLAAVQAWLKSRSTTDGEWPWSVWTWVPEGRRPSGEIEPAFWYEECRCRNQADAQNILELFQKKDQVRPVCVGTTRPTDPPEALCKDMMTYPKPEEG